MELVNRTDNISVPLLVNISFSRTLNVEAAEYKERIQSETVSTLQLSFPIAITSIFLLTALDSHRTHLHFCPTTHLSASRANQKRAQATPAEWKPVCQQQPAGWKTKDPQGGAADVERETKLLQRRFVLKKQKLNHVWKFNRLDYKLKPPADFCSSKCFTTKLMTCTECLKGHKSL